MLPLVLLVPLAGPVTARAAGEALAHRPEPGQRLTKTYVQRLELELEKQTYVVLLDGVEQSATPLPGEIRMRELELETFKDLVLAVEGGRVTELRRTYAKIVRESFRAFTGAEGEPQEMRELAGSDLERAVVAFRWDPAVEGYAASFAEGERAAELLAGLLPTTDLEGFLPQGEVVEGDSWEPAVIAREQTRIVKDGGRAVSVTGTLLVFDVPSGYFDLHFGERATFLARGSVRILPIVTWTKGATTMRGP